MTGDRWPLVARVGRICFWVVFFGLGFDWVVEWLNLRPWDGGMAGWREGRMSVIGMYPAGCEVGGVARSWLGSVVFDDANSRSEVKTVLTRQ